MVQHIKHPSIFSFLSVFAAIVVALAPASRADDAESEAVKLAQRSSYNVFTGNWDVSLDRPALSIAESFKRILPALDYHLVDEAVDEKERVKLTFRGEGDQRVLVKLKEMNGATNVRIHVGRLGNEAKSSQLFTYVYERME